ncbi:MAG: glutaminyl-peptide cyclotransferase [Armatimonadetes bacterium]|nr:glutaminyl-peptide cyclotransferase [Armatimonadota bacterium]
MTTQQFFSGTLSGLILGLLLASCSGDTPPQSNGKDTVRTVSPTTPPDPSTPPIPPPTTAAGPEEFTFTVVNKFPHDPKAYTQGLVWLDGFFYETTGLNGESTLRKVDPTTGRVLQKVALDREIFGEGMTIRNGKIYQVTWRNQTGFIYDLNTFSQIGSFQYPGEGWGLTQNDQYLILSDGTNILRYLDPTTLHEVGRVSVFDGGRAVDQLNELEFVNGKILANIYQTDRIAQIDPYSGNVTGWINLSGLLKPEERGPDTEVLNGIAYDAKSDRLFVTGKRWPFLFQITLQKASQPVAANHP